MLDVVLACYFRRPISFAEHAQGLPELFTGRRRKLIQIYNRLAAEMDSVTLEAVEQEYTRQSGTDGEKLRMLQDQIDAIAKVDVDAQMPYVLSRVALWIRECAEERAADRYVDARARVRHLQSDEARQELKEARDHLVTTALGLANSIQIESDSELMDAEIPEAGPVIEGLLDAGMVGLFGASSKSYKTWVSMMLACGVAYTGRWLGFRCMKGKVLYLNYELTRKSAQDRLKAIYGALGIQPKNMIEVVQLKGAALEPEVIINTLMQRCRLKEYRLIIIDPLYVFEGGKAENSNDEMALLMLQFIALATKTGTAVWICHHFSKGNQALKDLLDRFAGAGALGRAIDTAVGMTPHKEHNDGDKIYTMEFEVRNHKETDPFVVRWQYPLMVVATGYDPAELKQPRRGAASQYADSDFLHCLPAVGEGAPLTYGEWKKAVMQSTGIRSDDTFKRRRKALVEAGKVVHVGDGYAKPVSKISVNEHPNGELER